MYLKKSKNGNYSFRWRVPLRDRNLFNGKTEIIKTLKTKNAKIAHKRAKPLRNGLPVLKERLRAMTDREVDVQVNDWLEERLEADLNGRIEKSSLSGFNEVRPNTKILDYTDYHLDILTNDLAELKTASVAELASSFVEEDEINEDLPHHKRLLFQLLRANVQYFKTLTKRNLGQMDFHLNNKLTYQEAVEEYLPRLLDKARARAKHKNKAPHQYTATKKFLIKKFLIAVGEDTLLHDRSSECIPIISSYFTRDDGTVGRDAIEYMKAFYLWLFDNNLIPTNISKDLVFERVVTVDREAFSPSMVNKILTKTTGDINSLFRIYLYTGMRLSEFFDSDFDEGTEDGNRGFLIRKGKNENALRFIPQHTAIQDIDAKQIQRLKHIWNSDRTGRKLNAWINKHISNDEKHSLHSTRHCFNTWMVNAGVQESIIKPILGHEKKKGDMTNYYTTHFETNNDKLEAVNSVNYTLPIETN